MIERSYPYLVSIAVLVAIYFSNFNIGQLTNYKEIMSSAISFGSIAVGFLAAAITLLPSMSNNNLVKNLKRMGAYRKLLNYIITAILGLFAISILSIIGLFIDGSPTSWVDKLFNYIWCGIFVFSLLSSFRVISLFLKFLVLTQNNEGDD